MQGCGLVANIAARIEEYLLRLLAVSPRQHLDVQRKELAEKFSCVPSQINYVLETRFTLERGFMVESRRGGGGYLRISRINVDRCKPLLDILRDSIGTCIGQKKAADIIELLEMERAVTRREGAILRTAVKRQYFPQQQGERDALRAEFLKDVLQEIIKYS